LIAIGNRLTLRDAIPLSAWIYYPSAWLLLVMAAALACVLWSLLRAWRRAMLAAAIACLCTAAWAAETHDNPCRDRPGAVRVLFWNISRGRGTWEKLIAKIHEHDADLIALAEAGKPNDELRRFWRERFPDAHVELPGGGLALISRSAGRNGRLTALPGISSMFSTTLDIRGRELQVVLVDLDASPRFDKRDLLARVFAEAGQPPNAPTIVLGDFNTTLDSRWFRSVRSDYAHAFERAGLGRPATWPAAFPLVAIDHVWLSKGLEPLCTLLPESDLSDHRAVLVDVDWPTP
jgi:endonuclease/exonuclease/phosphatase (EEP) superfamily protein YafD